MATFLNISLPKQLNRTFDISKESRDKLALIELIGTGLISLVAEKGATAFTDDCAQWVSGTTGGAGDCAQARPTLGAEVVVDRIGRPTGGAMRHREGHRMW
jgi:hypothetical protein